MIPQRETFLVAYRPSANGNGARCPEERDVMHVIDVEKITAATDENIIDEVSARKVKAPTREGEPELPAHVRWRVSSR